MLALGCDSKVRYWKIGEGSLSTYDYAGTKTMDDYIYTGFWVLNGSACKAQYTHYVEVNGKDQGYTPTLEVGMSYYIYKTCANGFCKIVITSNKPIWWDNVLDEFGHVIK
jgi:hypothetical protein